MRKLSSSILLAPRSLALAFIFFMGSAFHCLDWLGVERTVEWGMGMVFAFAMMISLVFWYKKLVRLNILKFIS